MPNTQVKFGFRHIGYLGGGAPDYQLSTGKILAANATKIFRGDPIQRNTATGNIEQATAPSTNAIVGIFDGCMYTPVGGTPQWSPFWPGAAGSDATAYFIDAPNAVFQVATLLTPIGRADIGGNVQFDLGVGNQVTGVSAATVIAPGSAANPGFPFRVIAPCTNEGNYGGVGNGYDPTSNFNWCIVTFNNQNFKQLAGL